MRRITGLVVSFLIASFSTELVSASPTLTTDSSFFDLLIEQEKTTVPQAQAVGTDSAKQAKVAEVPGHTELQYVNRSVEFGAIQEEVYQLATKNLLGKKGLLSHVKTDWAIVLDVDETVLDNSEGQRRMLEANLAKSSQSGWNADVWNAWVKEKAAPAVPGAKKFLDAVRAYAHAHPKHKGRIVYITDRDTTQEQDTVENLIAAGLFVPGEDIILTKKNPQDTKNVRRACIEKGNMGTDNLCRAYAPANIVALFGDSYRDHFERYGSDVTNAEGRRLLKQCVAEGRCYVLSNPEYGQWQSQNADGSYYGKNPNPPASTAPKN